MFVPLYLDSNPMNRLLFSIVSLLVSLSVYTQQLTQVSFNGASTLSSFSIRADQGVLIKISDDGRVLEWGTEWESYRYDYRPGRLQPFMGRIDYYGPEADSINRGKLKSVGTTFLTYYGMYETDDKKGKLRSIGSCFLEYFNNYENQVLRGKIKWVGTIQLEYYSAFENEAVRGKLKMVGNNIITYYSTFDEKLKIGKIKTIGPLHYTWTDNRGFQGSWQSIPMAPVINGVTYIIM